MHPIALALGFFDCSFIFLPKGLERDKFDNKTVSFEEHIKLEHNIWNYLYFIVLVREKNKTDYTGPESYVAHMIKVNYSLLLEYWMIKFSCYYIL